jgi:hypothetical protein
MENRVLPVRTVGTVKTENRDLRELTAGTE